MELWHWALLVVAIAVLGVVVWDVTRDRPKKDPPRTGVIGVEDLGPPDVP